jgi:hypothetical protein
MPAETHAKAATKALASECESASTPLNFIIIFTIAFFADFANINFVVFYFNFRRRSIF